MKNILCCLALLCSYLSFSQQQFLTTTPQLQTKATYTTEVTPDKITLSINLSEENTKGKVSIEQLEQRLEKVLIENKVNLEKQLFLADLSSSFKKYFLRKTDVQKTKNYRLILFDAQSIGRVLQALEQQQIANVTLLKTEYTALETLKIELKGKAVEKATRQAKEMIKSLNQELGPAIFISDLETFSSNASLRGMNSLNGYVAMESEQLFNANAEFDKIVISATVTVYFKLD